MLAARERSAFGESRFAYGIRGFSMTISSKRRHPSRRAFLRGLAQATTVAGGGLVASRAFAQDATLQALIDQNLSGDFGQGFDSASRTIHMPKASLPTLSPATVQHTEQAIQQFEGIVAQGGWPEVGKAEGLRLGSRQPAVVALRKRLMLSGDLDAGAGMSDIYDSYVEAGVRRFQARHGLSTDGVVREQTIRAMNVPAATRLAQLRTNAVRLRALSGNLGNRYVMCNIPAARIEAIESGVAVSRHTAVVGKPDRPSPDINSKIIEINFNPYWTVPVSIVRRDLIPKMQAEPDYLTSNRIRILDPQGNELTPSQINWYSQEAVHYRFKQDPGDFNSLGTIRINFPNKDGVYMHDTPAKNLFGEDFRYDSSGCVRVQNVRELVSWLMADAGNWSRQEIDAVIKSGERKDARLPRPVPLYWVYVTAWATPDGVTQFREDIYGHDGVGPVAVTKRG
jgi:murein L,D-transpeptidase YcbB/YkuD